MGYWLTCAALVDTFATAAAVSTLPGLACLRLDLAAAGVFVRSADVFGAGWTAWTLSAFWLLTSMPGFV